MAWTIVYKPGKPETAHYGQQFIQTDWPNDPHYPGMNSFVVHRKDLDPVELAKKHQAKTDAWRKMISAPCPACGTAYAWKREDPDKAVYTCYECGADSKWVEADGRWALVSKVPAVA